MSYTFPLIPVPNSLLSDFASIGAGEFLELEDSSIEVSGGLGWDLGDSVGVVFITLELRVLIV